MKTTAAVTGQEIERIDANEVRVGDVLVNCKRFPVSSVERLNGKVIVIAGADRWEFPRLDVKVSILPRTECRNCGGRGRVEDVVHASITHRRRTVQRRCRYCSGTGRLAPAAAPVEGEIGEIPEWMTGVDEQPIYDLGNSETTAADNIRAEA